MTDLRFSLVPLLLGLVLAAGCTKREVPAGQAFDAAFIASEADKGNLEPLKALNAACGAEVEAAGTRASVCEVQDQVRALRKPLNIRF